ncbi:MAG: hypothetical protein MUF42_01760 [Cytophagaceae bacterium]|nr:hypothetical protein [Cytophagaceae bacterium]
MNEVRWNVDAGHHSLMIINENIVLFSNYPETEGINFPIKDFKKGLHHDRISTIFGNDVLQEMLDFINR